MNILDALSNLKNLTEEELLVLRDKLDEIKNNPAVFASLDITETEKSLTKKIMEEILSCVNSYHLNFGVIQSNHIIPQEYSDIIRKYHPATVIIKINRLLSSIYL